MHKSLFERAMGADFAALHPALRAFHAVEGRRRFEGTVDVHAPEQALARVLARVLGTPIETVTGAIAFELDTSPTQESWTRFFPGKKMTSTMVLDGAHVVEKLGPCKLWFSLQAVDSKLHMRLTRMRFASVPCPRFLLPQVTAIETGVAGHLEFNVKAALPLIGTVAHYVGRLKVQAQPLPH